MSKKRKILSLCVVLSIVAAGCSSRESNADGYAASTPSAAKAVYDPASNLSEASKDVAGKGGVLISNSPKRNVVREANLTVEVENLEASEKAMKKALEERGGYIQSEAGENLAGEEPVMKLSLRVPEPSFEDLLGIFEGLGRRTNKSIYASDITEQVMDSRAEIAALKGEQDRQRKNGGDLSYINNRIKESLEQQSSLAAAASISTIELTLQQKPNIAGSNHAGWGSDTWNAALSSAMGTFRVIGACAIWLLCYSPVWGLAILAALYARRWLKPHSQPARP